MLAGPAIALPSPECGLRPSSIRASAKQRRVHRACWCLTMFASFSDAGDGERTRARRVDRRAGVRSCRPACQPDGLWPRQGPHGLLAPFAAAATMDGRDIANARERFVTLLDTSYLEQAYALWLYQLPW